MGRKETDEDDPLLPGYLRAVKTAKCSDSKKDLGSLIAHKKERMSMDRAFRTSSSSSNADVGSKSEKEEGEKKSEEEEAKEEEPRRRSVELQRRESELTRHVTIF